MANEQRSTKIKVGGKLSLFPMSSKRGALTTLLNEGELHCEDSGQNITCEGDHVMVLFCLPDCHFLPNSLSTCNRIKGYVAR